MLDVSVCPFLVSFFTSEALITPPPPSLPLLPSLHLTSPSPFPPLSTSLLPPPSTYRPRLWPNHLRMRNIGKKRSEQRLRRQEPFASSKRYFPQISLALSKTTETETVLHSLPQKLPKVNRQLAEKLLEDTKPKVLHKSLYPLFLFLVSPFPSLLRLPGWSRSV